jgi:hypothetical protein
MCIHASVGGNEGVRRVLSEYEHLQTNGFVGHDDAARGQEFFDIPKTPCEPSVPPHRMANDFSVVVADVWIRFCVHRRPLADFNLHGNLTIPVDLRSLKAHCADGK